MGAGRGTKNRRQSKTTVVAYKDRFRLDDAHENKLKAAWNKNTRRVELSISSPGRCDNKPNYQHLDPEQVTQLHNYLLEIENAIGSKTYIAVKKIRNAGIVLNIRGESGPGVLQIVDESKPDGDSATGVNLDGKINNLRSWLRPFMAKRSEERKRVDKPSAAINVDVD